MIRRVLLGLVALVALFALVLALTFPTDHIVRSMLAGVRLPQGASIDFAHATLRPWGLTLDGVAVRRFDRTSMLDAPWLRVQPSLLGLFATKPGFPWTLSASMCAGEVEVRVDHDGATQAFDMRWTELDVGACLRHAGSWVNLAGRLTGSASLRQAKGVKLPTGSGDLTMHDAVWEPPLPQLNHTLLHADSAVVRWTVTPERITFEQIDLRGPEIELVASGEAVLGRARRPTELDLQVELTPMEDMPAEFDRLLANLPTRPDGTWAFRVTGTPDAPRVEPR